MSDASTPRALRQSLARTPRASRVDSLRTSLRGMLAIAKRDFYSAFVAATGWIVLAIVGIVASVTFFAGSFDEGTPASLRTALLATGWALLATAPAISMRAFSEEFRLKTWETLFAAPLGVTALVLGKALACAGLVAVSLLPVALLALPLEIYSTPDYGEIACGLLGLFLAGMSAAAIGIAVSTTTASQTVAFLGAFFSWLGLVAGSRILVNALPLEYAPIAAACDPLQRLEGFALGLFDSGAVAFFVAIIVVSLVAGIVSLERIRDRAARTRVGRGTRIVEGALFLTVTLCAVVAATAMFSQPALRYELDATKTRRYSLAPSTTALLEQLNGPWQVLLFVDATAADKAVLRQIDEVLERFHEANPNIDARRIDPSDPAASGAFEEALASIVATRAGDLARAEDAIRRGLTTYELFRASAASQPAGLRAAAQTLPTDSTVRRALEQVAALFAQVNSDGEQFATRVNELSRTTASRPLPDIEGARSALAQGFRVWGDQLASAAALFAQWRADPVLPSALRAVVSSRIDPYEQLAASMQTARQELEALPTMEFNALGRELMQGDAAVVAGAGHLAVVPAWRIFPRAIAAGEDRVTYSWSFRGEEVLTGALRSISSQSMPEVVFVHSERDSLLRAKQDGSELAAVTDALRSAGFSVREWTPGRGERPTPVVGTTQVFVIIPALRRGQFDLSREERLLAEEAARLINDGAPVLLTAGRSMLAVMGQADPWQRLLAPFGLEPDAARVVLEMTATADGTPEVRPWQLIERVPANSALSSRLRGRAILLNQAMRIRIADPLPEGVRVEVAVEVEPSTVRWLAEDWRENEVREVPVQKRFSQPLPVAVMAERKLPVGSQRVMLVGSGGWLLTSVADLSDSLGGGRTALVNPGNREMLLASVSWLAGREDLLDAGLSGREVARIEGLTPNMRRVWSVSVSAILALAPMALGALVIQRRRRRA